MIGLKTGKKISWKVAGVGCLISLFVSFSAQAFKLPTHIWVAEQVWNDLSDNSVNIPPFGEIPVDPEIAYAIRANKGIYLSGSIGPDGFPDMIGGQMTAHPGISGGWQTDDWAKWLLQNIPSSPGTTRNQALAFTYGYFSHLSADVFAHSYVNTYAGDTFELFDGETAVERRHMLIEAYIDKYAPITNPESKIAVGSNLPLDWLTKTIIMNRTVEEQYYKNGANDNATLHLSLMHDYEDKIDEIIRAAQAAQDFLDRIIGDLSLEIVENVPPELLNPAHAALSAGNTLCQEVINNGGNEGWSVIVNPVVVIGNGGGGDSNPLSNPISEVIERELDGFVDNVAKAVMDVVGEDAALCLINTNACIANYTLTQYTLTQAIERLPDVPLCISPSICMNVWLAEQYCEVSAEIVAAHEEYVNLNTQAAAIMFMKNSYLGALIAYLREWKATMLPAAKSWTSLSSDIVKGVMRGENPFDYVANWFDCWGFVYAGATTQIQGMCEIVGSLLLASMELFEEVQNAKSKLAYATLDLVGINAQKIVDELEGQINDLKQHVHDFVKEKIVPQELIDVLELTSNGVTPELINREFQSDYSNFKYLIEVPRMAERMEKEMHLVSEDGVNWHFDPNQFAPVYNAIILSKLALLNANQLNELAKRAGMTKDLYSKTLNNNVLVNAIRSIDGNHQWLAKAPPYPRKEGFPDQEGDVHFYGYQLTESHGFRLYQDSEARRKIFNRIFKGLLAPGIEKPSIINESPVLPASYLYRPCFSIPYPNGVSDQSCTIEYLIPIFTLLN